MREFLRVKPLRSGTRQEFRRPHDSESLGDFHYVLLAVVALFVTSVSAADHPLLTKHCGDCHSGDDPEGDFSLDMLGQSVTDESRELWTSSFGFVKAKEMPPADDSDITDAERSAVAEYLRQALLADQGSGQSHGLVPRRLNNREFANSVASVLMIEDVGTQQPLGNLLGDTLHEGFDTNGDTLGISEYHLEQYIDACRKIVDAVVISGEKPESTHYVVSSDKLRMSSQDQRTSRAERGLRRKDSLEFTDPRLHMYFENFETVPTTGRYHIRIRATGVDRGYYDSETTGIYDGDPIQLQVNLGDRQFTYDLPDNEILDIELSEWLAEGTRIQLSYPTDGLRLIGNGNFKFQNKIAHDYIKEHDEETYQNVLTEIVAKARFRKDQPSHWSHWTDYWRGPRPRVFGAEIEGPLYESWPPQRTVTLLGEKPDAKNAEAILRPIAERAWRRSVRDGELDTIVQLVQRRQNELGDVEAIKEGILAVLITPSFLLINSEEGTPADRFATKVSYFFTSTPPDARMRESVASGKYAEFDSVNQLVAEVVKNFDDPETSPKLLASSATGNCRAEAFLSEFPRAWLQLDRINFMAPDPDRYPFYHKKSVSDDMIAEATAMFRHAVENNLPLPELLTADYSFVNADLAEVYGIEDIAQDSKLRKHLFADGRRGGLLGMGAFLTLTADSLGTSPIHRGVYVLENILGTKPSPPPGDIEIPEPDVRSATTIKEVLQAHVSNETCASCHRSIDPYGYAFENFDVAGGWRDAYVQLVGPGLPEGEAKGIRAINQKRNRPQVQETPIDSSATFRSGDHYNDIIEFRELMQSKANQERFVRCFIKKLLLYANGEEPEDFAALDRILETSAQHEYRIVETIAAVVDSPLFRGE